MPIIGSQTRLAPVSGDQLLHMALSASPTVVYAVDLQGAYVWGVNTQLGSPFDKEGLTFTDFDLFPHEEAQFLQMLYAQTLVSGSTRVCTALCPRTSGRTEYFDISMEPMQDVSGVTSIVCAATCITGAVVTAQRLTTALIENRMLLRELHHRVKNHLQIVSGLLAMEAAKGPAECRQHLAAGLRRVEALATVHELLHQHASDGKTVMLDDYLGILCSNLAGEHVTCKTDADRIGLGMDIAAPLGMLVNEVVTNSLKHGFPDGRGGLITLEAHRVADRIELTLTDNGAGSSAGQPPGTSTSLGLSLIDRLAKQLGGEPRYEFTPAGSIFRLSFPARQPDERDTENAS